MTAPATTPQFLEGFGSQGRASPVSRGSPAPAGASTPSRRSLGRATVAIGTPLEDVGPSQRQHLCVEQRNDRDGRTLRVTQKELLVIGPNKFQTRIEIFDTSMESCPLIFSVKHTHSPLWGRQAAVHKNLLLACQLTGVESPLEISLSSRRLYENTENVQHTYMERIVPHVKLEGVPEGVTLYWWRAVGNGATILQNNASGRMIVSKGRYKTIPSAANSLQKILNLVRDLPPAFTEVMPDYPLTASRRDLQYETPDGRVLTPNPEDGISLDELRDAVQRWALEASASPWMTKYIVRVHSARRSQVVHFRYSVGLDAHGADAICTQVHSNEPLSRELKAFPVCMVPIPLTSMKWGAVFVATKQSLWFLKKLHDFHIDYEHQAAQTKPTGSRNLFPSAPPVHRTTVTTGARSFMSGVGRRPGP